MNPPKRRVQFYGTESPVSEIFKFHLKEQEIAGFNLTETRLPANYVIPKHSHDNASFCFVLAGTFTEKYDKKTKEGKPFGMIFSPIDEVHSDHIHNVGGHCFFLEFSRSSLNRAREYSLYLDEPSEFQGGVLALISMRLYREFCQIDATSPLIIEGLAFEVMAEVSRQHVKSFGCSPPRWLGQVKDLLHAKFAETITLVEISEVVDVHPVHLARVFRKFNDCTLGEYVRRLRIENASQQLLTSNASLAEIALTLGFSDQAHFSRTFKNQIGLTPTEFRNTLFFR